VTAVAQNQSAQAKLVASKAAFERAQDLLKSRSMALAQLQAAEAAFGVDEAALATAQAQVKTIRATAFEEFGPVIGKALVEDDALIRRLIEREAFLIQITLQPGMSIDPPPTATVQLGGVPRVEVRFLSVASQADPKIQGFSFYYVADGESRLLCSGCAAGRREPRWRGCSGFRNRVVGRSRLGLSTHRCRNLQTPSDPNRSPRNRCGERRRAGRSVPAFPPDFVTRGAQALLSEELRAQIQVGGNDPK
jgi:hypothetical protein